MSVEPSLRERARGAVRDEVMRQAWGLFHDRGFEATTVDEIAEASGMSRRTFFRYFAGKDALVLERLIEAGDAIARDLDARPAGEPAWTALRAAFAETIRIQEDRADRARALQLMLRDEPSLRAVLLERRRRWEDLLAPLVAQRLAPTPATGRPDPQLDPGPRAVAGAALACLESAQELWAVHPGLRLAGLVDEAMGAVRDLR